MTRVSDQHPDVFPSSPNALLAVFTSVLQARFFEPNEGGLPWVWTADPTPEDDDAGALPGDDEEEAPAPRRIYIELASTQYPTARNVRPALLVGRGTIQFLKLGTGNRVAHDYPRGGEALLCHAVVPITVSCLSRDSGESQTLADVVASFFVGSAPDIRAAFGVHSIEMPTIAETVIYKRAGGETEFWNTAVTLGTEIQFKWWRWPLAPVLRELALRLDTNGQITDLREVLQRRTP
jgi:hypothetical protein